jgi:hypothetical protein
VAIVTFAAILLMGGCAAKPKVQPTAEAAHYTFWPDVPDEPHIQFLTSYNSSADVTVKQKKSGFEEMVYGTDPEQSVPIAKPYGVRMWNGRIYVCDIRSKGITVLDLRKKQARIMGATGRNAIGKAVDIAITPDGIKYVVDAAKGSIDVFDAEERYLTSFLLKDASPVGAAVFQNLLYVVDFKNTQVKVLDRLNGQILRTFGERGGEDGQFIGPLAVACDKQGNVYVSDPIRARIQKFAPDGKFIMGFGQPGDRPGQFIRPKQMGIGSDGRIHVVDAAFNNVQVFDAEGQVEGFYGSAGNFEGSMDLPAGLDVHEQDLDLFASYVHPAFEIERVILVTNQFGPQTISVYAMGHLKAGKTVADIGATRGTLANALVPSTQPAATQPTISAEIATPGTTTAAPAPQPAPAQQPVATTPSPAARP